ncbi:YdcF family protein [Streptomyces sp. NPDC058171]
MNRPRSRRTADRRPTVTEEQWRWTELIWDYHRMGHPLRPADVAIALGSHDLGVATAAADLHHRGLFPVLVFTGGNSPTTKDRFPRGEAVHFSEHARERGVPDSAVLVEPNAVNTGENITFTRELLASVGLVPHTVLLVTKPWPEAEVVCASEPLELGDYVKGIGDERLVVDMLVGDLQRVIEYPERGFAIAQDVPADVRGAYEALVRDGFTSRLIDR